MRASEQVDIEDRASLEKFLRETGRVDADEPLNIQILAGGVSNKTVLVTRSSGESWVLKQALPKLRTAIDWFSDPSRIRREALGLKYLAELAPAGTITPLVFEAPDQFLLAMEAVPQPHENWKSMLLAGTVEVDHVGQFGGHLGQIHRKASERRDELLPLFADRSFFESLRIEPYYTYTAGKVDEAGPFLHALIDETRASRFTLVHGDYSPKNVLVHKERLILLDHEVIHWGDGAFDLGFGLSHLLSKAHHLAASRDAFRTAAKSFWAAYVDGGAAGADVQPRAVRHALGCLLARVAGRSTLEYLDDVQRRRQAKVVLSLMNDPPRTVFDFADRFVKEIESN